MKNTEITAIINEEIAAHKVFSAAQHKEVLLTQHGNGYTVCARIGEFSPLTHLIEYSHPGVTCTVYGIMGADAIRKALRKYLDRFN